MNSAEIKFMKQECKRMIKENFAQAFDWMAQVISTMESMDELSQKLSEDTFRESIPISRILLQRRIEVDRP